MYTHDSRKIKKGDTFICLPGGELYIQEALDKGATEVLHMDRRELADFADKVYDHPSKECTVIGITGTNGKTTVGYVLMQALKRLGKHPYFLGTINSPLTTPESLETQQYIREHVDNGGDYFIMEVSSHGIAQDRVLGIDFDIRCLTNITQDHLDYHKTFEAYKQTKLSFLQAGSNPVYPEDYQSINLPFPSPLKGKFNELNIKAVYKILQLCNFTEEQIETALSSVEPPPGRFEEIKSDHPFSVIVDFAHTPDGLETICKELVCLVRNGGRLMTLFGCGGDRDTSKRPKMGKIAYDYSDVIMITQDNPRSEDPQTIIDDILKGIPNNPTKQLLIQNDRQKAIQTLIHIAQENDIILLAGKGHETTQILKHKTIHLSDKEEALNALAAKS